MEKNILSIYYKEIKKIKKENVNESEMFLLAKENKDIFNKIVSDNLGLVFKVGAKYATKDFPIEDVIQEGNIGLIKAIERFNPNKKVKFSTYAIWWIKHYIFTAIFCQKRIIRLPCNKEKEINAFNKRKNILLGSHSGDLSNKELSILLNVEEKKINNLNKINYDHIQYDAFESFNLDLCDSNCYLPDIISEENILKNEIKNMLSELDVKTAKIISSLFGLMNVKKISVSEISKKYNVSSSKIKQIKNNFFVFVKKKYGHLKDFI